MKSIWEVLLTGTIKVIWDVDVDKNKKKIGWG
jgi:hypothetical protein